MRQSWALLLALVYAFPACGGDDDSPGGGSGATGGVGGPIDTQAPDFAGLTSATQMGDSRIELVWSSASDDSSPEGAIAYRVYAATQAGAHDFNAPLTTTPAGATHALVSDLTPNTHYYFVVRAVDRAGNEDQNTVEKDAQTIDTTPPRFAGVVAVTAKTSRSLLVEWKPARDKGSVESAIRYRVYVSSSQGGQDFATPTTETAPGETAAVITGLLPLTEYYVVVRAVDASGNAEDNLIERSDRTAEGVAPVFGGIRRAEPWEATLKLYWAPATDNISEQANIRYNIYQALTSGGQDFTTPSFTTNPATISFIVPNLAPSTRYYYVVRAVDSAGNEDTNTIQVSARTTTGADTVAPNFPGVSSVEASSPTSLLVSWPAAHDATEPIVYYDLYASDTSGTQNYSTPTLTAGPNVTSALLAGLAPGATRFVVVRARDAAGNVAAITVEKGGSTPLNPTTDLTAPVWQDGPTAVIGTTLDSVDVSWTAASDTYPATDIRYHVCAEPQELDCIGTSFIKNIHATSNWGASSIRLSNLLPRTRYFIYVRAEDRSGNLETGNHSVAVMTRTGWSSHVQPLLVDKCNGCHSFDTLTLVNRPSGFFDPAVPSGTDTEGNPLGMFLVYPGRPEASYLYRKVNPLGLEAPPFSAAIPNKYSGLREPRDGANQTYTPLSQEEDAILHDWIVQGALGN